jgi:hypothetical protein
MDTMAAGGRLDSAEEARKGKVFTVPTTFALPKCLNFNAKGLKSNDRAAGTAANQRAAAATAWILANSASGFVNGPMSWTGDTCLNSFFQIENYIFGVIHKRDMGYLD